MALFTGSENLNSLSLVSNYMHLKIFVNEKDDFELKQAYKYAVEKHNLKLKTDPFMDAGFDILMPSSGQSCMGNIGVAGRGPTKIDFLVKCSAQMCFGSGSALYTGYYMYPRSSLSKTKLRLANSVGIIDSGYRGNLIGMFDCFSAGKSALCECEYDYVVKPYERLVQICAPNLVPIYVEMVESVEDLSVTTVRGEGGFGSTSTF